jgi:diguanylate cyclase (GGDEF)-like protein
MPSGATDFTTERLRHSATSLKSFRAVGFAAVTTVCIVGAFSDSALPYVPAALSWLVFPLLIDRRLRDSRQPQRLAAVGYGIVVVLVVSSIAATDGSQSPLLAWIALPATTLGARFTAKGVVAGVAYAAMLLTAVLLVTDVTRLLEHPMPTLAALAAMLTVSALASTLGTSELEYRRRAGVDPLTGALNRRSLPSRLHELSQQADVVAAPLAILVIDVDHFKLVNDLFGHARGDTALREVALAIRGPLRAFELVWRLGGEEFVVALPGADLRRAALIGERVRASVERAHPAELDLTVSIGVACRVPPAVDPTQLLASADAALYAAKNAGRNCVRSSRAHEWSRSTSGQTAPPPGATAPSV